MSAVRQKQAVIDYRFFLEHYYTYVFFWRLGLVLASHRAQINVEEMVQFLGKRGQFSAVGELDAGSTDDSLKELSLQDDLGALMDVIRLDAKTLVKLLHVLFFLILVTAR